MDRNTSNTSKQAQRKRIIERRFDGLMADSPFISYEEPADRGIGDKAPWVEPWYCAIAPSYDPALPTFADFVTSLQTPELRMYNGTAFFRMKLAEIAAGATSRSMRWQAEALLQRYDLHTQVRNLGNAPAMSGLIEQYDEDLAWRVACGSISRALLEVFRDCFAWGAVSDNA